MPSYQLSHADLVNLWLVAGGSAAHADEAAAIAEAESGGCQYAKAGPTDDRPVKVCVYRQTNGENSYGLWQINRNAHPTYSAADLYTPLGNARAAVAISSDGNSFGPWTTYTNGAYKAYLGAGAITGGLTGAGTTPVPDIRPANAYSGYADLRNALSKHLPRQVYLSRKYGAQTLRLLGRQSRVKGRR
jgi:Lysozyme like domain